MVVALVDNQFDWVDFYKEFANKLLEYKDNRTELIKKVERIYEVTKIPQPTLDDDDKIVDIDPFTVFGMFNKKLKYSKRIKFITEIANSFQIDSKIPTSLDSIPILNPQNATFYKFTSERDDDEMDNLWGLFEYALAYAKEQSDENYRNVTKYFDLSINIKRNGTAKITMGLYWIAPDFYMNLDGRNDWFIYESGRIPIEIIKSLPRALENKITAEEYFEIVNKMRDYLSSGESEFKNFNELSFEAWRYSEELNKQRRQGYIKQDKENKGAASADEDVETVRYWMFSPGNNASYWNEYYNEGIMAIGWDAIGDLSQFNSKSEITETMQELYNSNSSFKNDTHTTWQFANEMKPGDIVFAKKGLHNIVGRGVVESDYIFDDDREFNKSIRKVRWTDKGEWSITHQQAMKTLTDITRLVDTVEELNSLFEDVIEETPNYFPRYDKEQFLEEVFIDEEQYDRLTSLIGTKMNVILQGAPGVGKTYVAKRLAYSLMGIKDPERVSMIQFHQSYSYEDFIMGFRPNEDGFQLDTGVFYDFCKKAEIDSDNDYYVIIDEINRGNVSKIFGEMFMLIEKDKRGIEVQLLYSHEKFSIPENVYIIGTMNTADRSLAMIDYALRRRFAFYDMQPGFKTDGFENYQADLENEKFDELISCVEKLNKEITDDDTLGEGFCIGHSYFCNFKDVSDADLESIVEYELIPLLKEYWFDEPKQVEKWSENLRRSIK